MFIMYFTEQPMSAYPEEEAKRRGGLTVLTFSNQFFDPQAGSQLYRDRLEEYKLVDEAGFDGIMLNEHHNAPFCMQPAITVWSSILAAVTKNVRIVTLGIPLPLWDNPLQVAEAFGMVDMISGGRLVAGIVRGGGTEQFAMNANPAYNRDRFQEAHDLMIKAWTQPGPFRWEGDHYQFRVVNPWALPVQKPHPRIWVPGVSSNETIEWAAEQRYTFIGLGLEPKVQQRVVGIYTETAHRMGYEPGTENFGQTLNVHVQDTEEKARKNAEEFNWMAGEFSGLAHPVWSSPSGYLAAARRRANVERSNGRGTRGFKAAGGGAGEGGVQDRIDNMTLVVGTPNSVINRIREIITVTKPGVFGMYATDGHISHGDNMRNIELLGEKVVPAVREIADELGIKSPFEAEAPVSIRYSTDLNPQPSAVAGDG
jgi:alkanesulfonate monooxygenase SsuD/methylene tetrahydromethanopterin reductase-like flavin-dependent oxidoreductase (luciferase family)